MTYDARPASVGSWVFMLRENNEDGPIAATVNLGGLLGSGTITVYEVPFTLKREGLSRSYDLAFEGQTLARAEPKGVFSTAYALAVEAAILDRDMPMGERARFEWVPVAIGGNVCELRENGERLGRVDKSSMWFRHFRLHFADEVPLALQAFCFALQLASLRRQSHG